MKPLDFHFYRTAPEETMHGFALRWSVYQERPFVTIKAPNRDYWSYFHISLLLFRSELWVYIQLTKLPFRNLEQYKVLLREKRAAERAREQQQWNTDDQANDEAT